MKIFKQSHSAEKFERGLPNFSTFICGKISKKTRRWDPLETLKSFRTKKSHSAEKIERGPLVSSGFLG